MGRKALGAVLTKVPTSPGRYIRQSADRWSARRHAVGGFVVPREGEGRPGRKWERASERVGCAQPVGELCLAGGYKILWCVAASGEAQTASFLSENSVAECQVSD